ncbi:MOSC domain-containing protein [Aureibaculum sp. 2210JD6-5]|uniref:MOSC domain-containing protein n=1 Tax=Aureibaculum sp. 2210JD6-5 TaxID=3103957 RepID=UPI002AADE05F|nr:MOSC domain-containing protein [Aureibaculum sp. 2210JD6-5]MDY7396539.1 MOSC domain-containing protein [Aureibaculum sp. 2210JD6-5]
MKIISLNIGERRTVQWRKKTFETGIFKYPVNHPIYLDIEKVKNDTIADRKHHGGIEQAVYAYGKNHYQYFKQLHPDLDWQYGMFGENITLSHLEETEIHVGEVYQLGEAKIQVTKSRQPCYKLGIRFNDQSIVKQFWNSTKCGVYFKVLQKGNVTVGDKLILLETAFENPTIAEVYHSKKPS